MEKIDLNSMSLKDKGNLAKETTDPDILKALIEEGNSFVVGQALKNESIPATEVKNIANNTNLSMGNRLEAVKHHAMPQDDLLELAKSGDFNIKKAILWRKDVEYTGDIFNVLLKDPDMHLEIVFKILREKNITTTQINIIEGISKESSDESAKEYAIDNLGQIKEKKEEQKGDKIDLNSMSSKDKFELAKETTDPDVLRILAYDQNNGVRNRALKNNNMPSDVLEEILEDPNEDPNSLFNEKLIAIGHINMPSNKLEEIARNTESHPKFREIAFGNSNMSSSCIVELLISEKETIHPNSRSSAIRNTALKEEDLINLVQKGDLAIRYQILKSRCNNIDTDLFNALLWYPDMHMDILYKFEKKLPDTIIETISRFSPNEDARIFAKDVLEERKQAQQEQDIKNDKDGQDKERHVEIARIEALMAKDRNLELEIQQGNRENEELTQ